MGVRWTYMYNKVVLLCLWHLLVALNDHNSQLLTVQSGPDVHFSAAVRDLTNFATVFL